MGGMGKLCLAYQVGVGDDELEEADEADSVKGAVNL